MKFIIRDDDVNFFYSSEYLRDCYDGIVENSPVSTCVVPFVKGDYFKWVNLAEHNKSEFEKRLDEFFDDDEVHPIGENVELVKLLKEWYKEGKIGISMHGIHHRNWNRKAKAISGNYISGAEMWTENDMTEPLLNAKNYVEKNFDIRLTTFTAPQNMISAMSYKSLMNVGLSINGDLWNSRDARNCIAIYGLWNYIKIVYAKLHKDYRTILRPLQIGNINFSVTNRLYPVTDIDELKRKMDYVHKKNGVFVLGTHSYAYNEKMFKYDYTLKEAILRVIEYAKGLGDVEFIRLEDL